MEVTRLANQKESHEDLFFLGITATTGCLKMVSELNRRMEFNLHHTTNFLDHPTRPDPGKLAVFTNKTESKSILDTDSSDEILLSDVANFHISHKQSIKRVALIQGRADNIVLLKKIKQLDYLLICNYELTNLIPSIKEIPGVQIVFVLKKEHLRERMEKVIVPMMR